MTYTAYLDGDLFFDTALSDDAVCLTSAEIELTAGGAGSFTFSVPPTNTAYGQFKKLTSIVAVYRDGVEIFYGRVYGISGEFNTVHTITCEGYLAALNDSLMTPFTHEDSLEALVTAFVEDHNSKCPTFPFEVGTLTVEDDYVYRAFVNYETAWTRLSDLVDSYGGYLSARHDTETDTVYLDWYESYDDEATQTIEFGSNLLDLTQESTADGIVTALIPFGATETDDDGNETTVDITSVTDNGENYIYDADAVAEFGWIWATNEWESVTEPANLLKKAQAYLETVCTSKVTIDVSAVDLALVDESIDHFYPCEHIHVISDPHGIDETFFCEEITLNLLNPSSDRMTLGQEREGYVSQSLSDQRATTLVIEKIEANYVTNEKVSAIEETIIENSTLIEQNADSITLLAETVTTIGNTVTSQSTQIAQTSAQVTILVSSVDEMETWFTFASDYFMIGKSDSDIHSEQDNDSYKFVDNAGNVLLLIEPTGVTASTVNISEQVSYKQDLDSDPEWATRLGTEMDTDKHNLDFVWIGG